MGFFGFCFLWFVFGKGWSFGLSVVENCVWGVVCLVCEWIVVVLILVLMLCCEKWLLVYCDIFFEKFSEVFKIMDFVIYRWNGLGKKMRSCYIL